MTDSFWEYFLFYRLAGFFYSLAWRHQLSSCPRFFPLFPGILATVSIHLILPPAVLKPWLCFFAWSLTWDSPVCSRQPPSWKLNSLYLFPLTKKVLLPLPSPCQAIHSNCYLYPVYPFFIHLVTECKHLLAFILTRICYFGCEELTYIPYSSFNGESLAAC